MRENLMDGLFKEMNRVRDIIKEYEHPIMKGAGAFAAHFMKTDIAAAEKAISDGDVVQMLQAYKKLQEHEN